MSAVYRLVLCSVAVGALCNRVILQRIGFWNVVTLPRFIVFTVLFEAVGRMMPERPMINKMIKAFIAGASL